MISPKELTTAKAKISIPPDKFRIALPTPDFIINEFPKTFPTVAPVPAPTLPTSNPNDDAF